MVSNGVVLTLNLGVPILGIIIIVVYLFRSICFLSAESFYIISCPVRYDIVCLVRKNHIFGPVGTELNPSPS